MNDLIRLIKSQPAEVWFRVAVLGGLLFGMLTLLQKGSRMAKLVVLFMVLVFGTAQLSLWIYHRNEPEWIRPVVQALAPFFPSVGDSRREAGTF